jgi:hypothetical protein
MYLFITNELVRDSFNPSSSCLVMLLPTEKKLYLFQEKCMYNMLPHLMTLSLYALNIF